MFDKEHTQKTKSQISENRKGKGLWKGTDRIPPNTGKTQSDYQKSIVTQIMSKDWKIITPTGETFIVTNLNKWAKENGLDQANLARKGNGSSKGFRAIRQ